MIPERPEGPLIDRALAAPPLGIEEIAPGNVLVLAPHPDDETLGCGQAVAAALDRGRTVGIVLVTDGGASHPGSRSHPRAELVALRRREFDAAVARLASGAGPGAVRAVALDMPDAALSGTREETARIREAAGALADEIEATSVWTAWERDPHCDHRATALAARQLVHERPDLALWSYVVWGRFAGVAEAPGARPFDRADAHERKRAAAGAYRSQLTGLIADDPDGFVMPPSFVDHFLGTPEIFVRG